MRPFLTLVVAASFAGAADADLNLTTRVGADSRLAEVESQLLSVRSKRENIAAKPELFTEPERAIATLDKAIASLERTREVLLKGRDQNPYPKGKPKGPGTADPVAAERQRQISDLQQRIVPNGSSPAHVAAARILIERLLRDADPAVIRRLNERRLRINLIPPGARLTDVPAFAPLRGQLTSDGRHWEDVDGVAAVPFTDGSFGVAFRADNLLAATGHPPRHLGYHEMAHCVHILGLDPATRAGIYEAFADIRARRPTPAAPAGRTFLQEYADSDSAEFFAQASAAYFGAGQFNERAKDLRLQEPSLFAVLDSIYRPRGEVP
jgi:hypothetical protein